MKNTKSVILFFLLLLNTCFAQVSICSWNLKDFGRSKSDDELEFIGTTVKTFDIITIQEVVAGNGGAQAVARLVAILNRKGAQWDYSISDPTSSSEPSRRERYAYVWKPSRVKKIGKSWLDQHFENSIEREPYMATFSANGVPFTLVSFHAVPKNRNPEHEIKYFKLFSSYYPTLNLIFMGDFNCSPSHTVFNPLRAKGYRCTLHNQKTSLKQRCKGSDCLASEYDAMFFPATKCSLKNSGVLHFYRSFTTLKEARKISDHLPIWGTFVFSK
jgi:endonuclease/exonuclease/phosphatase family metal-dependent hydrolase